MLSLLFGVGGMVKVVQSLGKVSGSQVRRNSLVSGLSEAGKQELKDMSGMPSLPNEDDIFE